jgi:hypothetical protein
VDRVRASISIPRLLAREKKRPVNRIIRDSRIRKILRRCDGMILIAVERRR